MLCLTQKLECFQRFVVRRLGYMQVVISIFSTYVKYSLLVGLNPKPECFIFYNVSRFEDAFDDG